MKGFYNGRFEVIMMSEGYDECGNIYALWDNEENSYFFDKRGAVLTFPTKTSAHAAIMCAKRSVEDEIRKCNWISWLKEIGVRNQKLREMGML